MTGERIRIVMDTGSGAHVKTMMKPDGYDLETLQAALAGGHGVITFQLSKLAGGVRIVPVRNILYLELLPPEDA